MTQDEDARNPTDEAFRQADPRSLQQALFNIANCYHQTAGMAIERGSEHRNADFAGPAIMCQSFAVEMLLKFFVAASHPEAQTVAEIESEGVSLRGHDFANLFRMISPSHQGHIASKHSESTKRTVAVSDFEEHLRAVGSNPFVKWRYVYEAESQRHINIELLIHLTESLGRAAEDVVQSMEREMRNPTSRSTRPPTALRPRAAAGGILRWTSPSADRGP